jgi:hypothetical protein
MISPKVSETLAQFAWYFRKVPNSSRMLAWYSRKLPKPSCKLADLFGNSETVQQSCLMVSESPETMSHACTRLPGTAEMKKRGCRLSKNTKNDHLMTT